MIENNIHSLMTVCKYCLVDKYSYKFTNTCPSKEEIIKAIFSTKEDKLYYYGLTWNSILYYFYECEANEYDNLRKKAKKLVRRKNNRLVKETVYAREPV